MLLCVILLPTKAIAAGNEYLLADYQDIIDQSNEELNKNIAITDVDAFMENVINKISPFAAPQIIKYYKGAGGILDENSTTWTFRANTASCTSFSNSSCTVTYKGDWTIPKTGVTDLAYLTYNITYYP